MQLVIRLGVPVAGRAEDVVIAHHDDGDVITLSHYPFADHIAPWAGQIEELDRIGPPPADLRYDVRPIRAPAIDLATYAASERYAREQATISVTAGGAKMLLSIARADRAELRGKLQDIASGLRSDTDVFKFADGAKVIPNADLAATIKQGLAYVQALFNKEAAIQPALGKTLRTMADVDAAFNAVTP